MEQTAKKTSQKIPSEEYFAPGHRACIGCGEVLALRLVCKALGKDVIIANATGCMEIVSSPFPHTSWEVPWIHTLFENTAAVASGIEGALKVLQRKKKISEKEITVVGMGGDGGTSDIGLQALSGALERGHNFLYVCFDNEAYMNTGIQRSSATPFGAMTTTSPPGKVSMGQKTQKKNMPAIAVAHNIPYVATANPSYPRDLIAKVQKAKTIKGAKYLHVYSVCPTGWRSAPERSIQLGKLAVETGLFPLYEVENGKYRLTKKLSKIKPLDEYLKLQGRFRHLTEDLRKQIQEKTNEDYAQLLKKVSEA
jgi:pyruvate ferredoxin oxidoreductase beta subunit